MFGQNNDNEAEWEKSLGLGTSALKQSAIMIHELYSEFVSAGFTKKEALYLVGQIVAAGVKEGNGSGQ